MLALALTIAASGAWLLSPTGPWASAWTAMVALAGVVVLRGDAWRSGALLASAVAAGACGLDLLAGIVSGDSTRPALKRVVVPANWIVPDDTLGYRLSRGIEALDVTRNGDELVYRARYSIDEAGKRVTPTGLPGATTYLFLGDSFVFGQGLDDHETLAAQFTRATGGTHQGLNFGVPGYGPNHLVRAMETGLIARNAPRDVRAVVTWIIPAQLERISGSGAWLDSSPRYVLRAGRPEFTGSFADYRWAHPVQGVLHLLRTQFAFVRAIGQDRQQSDQADLFIALILRLQELVRREFDAPLIVTYSWPDEDSHPNYSGSNVPQPLLVEIIAQLRRQKLPLVSMNSIIVGKDPSLLLIPHDGHPTAFSNSLLANELARQAKGVR